MKKNALVLIGVLLLFAGIVVSDLTLIGITLIVPEKEIDVKGRATKDLIEFDLKTKIEAVPEVKDYYTDKKDVEEATKIIVETFKGTDAVLIHTYYPNGTKAITISTKQAIELKEDDEIETK